MSKTYQFKTQCKNDIHSQGRRKVLKIGVVNFVLPPLPSLPLPSPLPCPPSPFPPLPLEVGPPYCG